MWWLLTRLCESLQHVFTFGCDWPIVHSIPQWLPAQTHLADEGQILPYDSASALVILVKTLCVILELTSVA